MKDVLNRTRINAGSVTTDEWEALEWIASHDDWLTPDDETWLAVRGLTALVDIRRGFEIVDSESLQLGVAQVKINNHGKAALAAHQRGEVYTYGEPLTDRERARLFKLAGLD